MTIRAGDLNRRIVIERRENLRDGFGQQVKDWSVFCAPFAKIELLSGRELEKAQAVNTEVSCRFTIRFRPGVLSAMRVRYQGQIFNIEAVLDEEMKHRELVLLCSRGLNDG